MKKYRFFLVFVFGIAFSLLWRQAPAQDTKKLVLYLFHSPHCKSCLQLRKEFLPSFFEQYQDKIVIKELNADEPNNLQLLLFVSEQYGQEKSYTPSILVGTDFLVGRKQIMQELPFVVEKYLALDSMPVSPLVSKDPVKFFKGFSVFTILWAGLIDGINPCAFAVIVFFISFLGVYGYKRKEMIAIGLFYTLSVFITYMLIGVGLFKTLYRLEQFYFIMKAFYYFIGAFCFILSFCALYDYLRYKRTNKSDGFLLQLPGFLKKKINLVIGKGLRERPSARIAELCMIAFVVGSAVSLLEAVCTGQVYLPTIAFILRIPELKIKALGFLILYNVMFIMPLAAVFILSLLGVSSAHFNQFLKARLGAVKITMALLFFVLGFAMLLLS